jgi:hypothetical protein
MPKTMDSNRSSLYYAKETSLKVLPVTPVWNPLEPNSYNSFGGEVKTVMREPITSTRQRAKGTITDLDVKAAFAIDFTQNNLMDLLQGFFFADAYEKPKSNPIKSTSTARTISAIAAGSITVSGSIGTVKVGHLLLTKGCTNKVNDSLSRVTASASPVFTVSPYKGGDAEAALVTEAPPAAATVEAVGFALHGDVLFHPTATQPFLSSAADVDFTTLNLTPGEWIYLGDNDDDLTDTGATAYNFLAADGIAPVRGYFRIFSISATQLVFDLSIGAVLAAGSGSGGSCAIPTSGFVSMYFGTVIKNEPLVANIKRTSYTLQRTLGTGSIGDNLEYVNGCIPNEFTLNVPSNSKLTADLSFVGMDTQQENATALAGTYNPLQSDVAVNTAEGAFALFLYKIVDGTALFGYATDEKLTVNNNTKPNKAIGTVGAIEATVGNFDVSGSVTCYFDDIAALQAVRNNTDVGLTNIFSQKNAGFVFDLPLLTLALPGAKVEKDKAIMADISHNASPGALNFTALYNNFAYLPDVAMA